MSKQYCFEYQGDRESFLKSLERFSNSKSKYFYVNDFIVDASGTEYVFGVARGGHSGGYWYKPTIIETDGKLIFKGEIERAHFSLDKTDNKKKSNKFVEVALGIISIPILLLIEIFVFGKSLIHKIQKGPTTKEDTHEDRLYLLMETTLGCTRI